MQTPDGSDSSDEVPVPLTRKKKVRDQEDEDEAPGTSTRDIFAPSPISVVHGCSSIDLLHMDLGVVETEQETETDDQTGETHSVSKMSCESAIAEMCYNYNYIYFYDNFCVTQLQHI